MPTLRSALFLLAVVPPVVTAQSDLPAYVLPNAQIIAGANVTTAKSSTFGQFMLSKIQSGDQRLQDFIQQTGFDPRHDVAELIVSTDAAQGSPAHWLIAANGIFGNTVAKVETLATANGGTVASPVTGVDLITAPAPANSQGQQVCVAFYRTNNATALLGDCASVQAAIQPGGPPASTLSADALARVSSLRGSEDLWFLSTLRLGQFGKNAPSQIAPIVNNPLLQKVQQTSGGVKFADASQTNVTVSGQAVMDTAQDASALLNVFNFFMSFVQSNVGNQPMGGPIASILSTLTPTVSGNALNVTLTIPETTLEQMFEMAHQQAVAGMEHGRPHGMHR